MRENNLFFCCEKTEILAFKIYFPMKSNGKDLRKNLNERLETEVFSYLKNLDYESGYKSKHPPRY